MGMDRGRMLFRSTPLHREHQVKLCFLPVALPSPYRQHTVCTLLYRCSYSYSIYHHPASALSPSHPASVANLLHPIYSWITPTRLLDCYWTPYVFGFGLSDYRNLSQSKAARVCESAYYYNSGTHPAWLLYRTLTCH
jgi:hypothetical protein